MDGDTITGGWAIDGDSDKWTFAGSGSEHPLEARCAVDVAVHRWPCCKLSARGPATPSRQIHSRATGSVIENVAPPPALFAADIVPPWRLMMERQSERPMPSPSGLLVTKGSKIASSFSSTIPTPLSWTSMSTFDSSSDFARTISRRGPSSAGLTHGTEGVEHEVQDDLLELNAVTLDRADVGRQVKVDRDFVQIRVAVQDALDDADHMVHIDVGQASRGAVALEHGVQPVNDRARPLGDLTDVDQRPARLLQIGCGCVEQRHADVGVGKDRREWLPQFMRQGRAELAEGGHASHMLER